MIEICQSSYTTTELFVIIFVLFHSGDRSGAQASRMAGKFRHSLLWQLHYILFWQYFVNIDESWRSFYYISIAYVEYFSDNLFSVILNSQDSEETKSIQWFYSIWNQSYFQVSKVYGIITMSMMIWSSLTKIEFNYVVKKRDESLMTKYGSHLMFSRILISLVNRLSWDDMLKSGADWTNGSSKWNNWSMSRKDHKYSNI